VDDAEVWVKDVLTNWVSVLEVEELKLALPE
jgi:hypothetical protein